MAFPAADQLLALLPGGGQPLTSDDALVYLTRWINSLDFQPTTDREQAVAEKVVERGALAELEARQVRESGRYAPKDLYDRIDAAEKLRKEYNNMRPDSAEAIEAPVVYVDTW